MDRKIGADDPDIGRAVEDRYAEEAVRQMFGTPKKEPSAMLLAVRGTAKLAFLVLFLIAIVAMTAKLAWLLLQAFFGI